MSVKPIQIDAKGMKCPRPIIELAKARRRIEKGHEIIIEADDLAFESDVKAWCETTGMPLQDLKKDGDVVIARILIR